MDQGGSAALRRWPGVSAGLSLGRPARRTPGHASPGPADEGGSAGNHRVQRRAVFPGLPVVQVAATASMAALPHCRTRRARPPGPGDHSEGSGRYRAPGAAAPDPASMGSAAPRFDHPAACAARAVASDETRAGTPRTPASGWPPGPRRRARHDRGNVQGDSPIPAAPAIMDRLRMASSPSVPAGQPQPVKVPGQRTREDRLDSLLRLTCLAAVREWGRSRRTYRPGHQPARDAGTARSF